MKTFVLMTKLASGDCQPVEYSAKQKARARSSQAWLDEIKEKCPDVKFRATNLLHLTASYYFN